MNYKKVKLSKLLESLLAGGTAIFPTDTIYALHALALNKKAVEKVFGLKFRSKHKPLIVLISALKDLNHFGIKLSSKQKKILDEVWPNKISIVLPSKNNKFKYLSGSENSIAFRLPKNKFLISVLKQTGPLVSTSANIAGQPFARTIAEAKNYFGSKVDLYYSGKTSSKLPSTVVRLEGERLRVLREGAVKIKKELLITA